MYKTCTCPVTFLYFTTVTHCVLLLKLQARLALHFDWNSLILSHWHADSLWLEWLVPSVREMNVAFMLLLMLLKNTWFMYLLVHRDRQVWLADMCSQKDGHCSHCPVLPYPGHCHCHDLVLPDSCRHRPRPGEKMSVISWLVMCHLSFAWRIWGCGWSSLSNSLPLAAALTFYIFSTIHNADEWWWFWCICHQKLV